MRLRNPTWTKVATDWGLLLLSTAVVMFELASGYSATWPIIGRVPGPPSEAMVHAMDTSVFLMLGLVVATAVPVILWGTWLKRTAIAIPVFLSLWLLVFNFVERVLK